MTFSKVGVIAMLALTLSASTARAELRHVELKTLGMD
jgi:hypothetical protein